LPCRFFYDAQGSELFEEITNLPEYYLARAETAILEANSTDIADGVPDGSVLLEFGSGSSLKTEILRRELPNLSAYAPIDVSPTALRDAELRLADRFPQLDVCPIVGDFSRFVALPAGITRRQKTGFFPGSTIGNFEPIEAVRLLAHFRAVLSPGGRLIVGVDLKKDAQTLVRAYDDAAGTTAAFNLNLLARINRDLGASFDLDGFKHKAIYNTGKGRIGMHLESTGDREVRIRGRRFTFRAGETIHTENAYKYSIESFQNIARSADWQPRRVWTDKDSLFSVHELTALKELQH
jgi:dimethylhistidine N-methyltransferase